MHGAASHHAHHAHHLPQTMQVQFSIDDMIHITSKLTQILTAESELLGAMKIREIAPFQEEKLKLSQQLESFQRLLATDNTPIRTADPSVRDRLLTLTDGLFDSIEENMRRTSIAQSINKKVMETCIEAMAEQQRLGTYGKQGHTNAQTTGTLSINLNEQA